jgi:RNA polymerase sigma-32 factor
LQVSCLQWVEIMGRLATADWKVTAKSGLSCYLSKIQQFPVVEPHEEYLLAKRWREHDDHQAAHALVAKTGRGYHGYGLPISDLISEGNVGLMGRSNASSPKRASVSRPTPYGGSGLRSGNKSCAHGRW